MESLWPVNIRYDVNLIGPPRVFNEKKKFIFSTTAWNKKYGHLPKGGTISCPLNKKDKIPKYLIYYN